MTIVHCPELNYLEAKIRKRTLKWCRKWTIEDDQMLIDYSCVDPAMLVHIIHRPVRTIMARQRELGVRKWSHDR